MLFELDLIPLWNDDHVPCPWSDFDIEKCDEADLRQIQLCSSPKTQMAPHASGMYPWDPLLRPHVYPHIKLSNRQWLLNPC